MIDRYYALANKIQSILGSDYTVNTVERPKITVFECSAIQGTVDFSVLSMLESEIRPSKLEVSAELGSDEDGMGAGATLFIYITL